MVVVHGMLPQGTEGRASSLRRRHIMNKEKAGASAPNLDDEIIEEREPKGLENPARRILWGCVRRVAGVCTTLGRLSSIVLSHIANDIPLEDFFDKSRGTDVV